MFLYLKIHSFFLTYNFNKLDIYNPWSNPLDYSSTHLAIYTIIIIILTILHLKKIFDIFYFSVLILLSISSIIYVISGSISIDCFFLLFVGHIFLLLCIIGNFSLNEKIPNFSWFDVGSFDILLNIVGIYLKSSYLEPVRSFWNLLFNFFKAGPEKPLVQNKFGPTIKEIPWWGPHLCPVYLKTYFSSGS